MLPIERKRKIKELVKEKTSMKISELSLEIGVSEMTIHRDIKPLIEEGFVTKSYGGITLASTSENSTKDASTCDFCHGELNERLIYRLFLTDHIVVTACCAHCGLLKHREHNHEVRHAICRDFLLQTTISAPLAWYVMDTSIQIGCCNPQILSFEEKVHAEQFVTGFGGQVYDFEQASDKVYQLMHGRNSS